MNTEINGTAVTPELVQFLVKYHCNALRINFGVDRPTDTGHPTPSAISENPLAPYQSNLAKLDAILPLCRKHGIQVILSGANIAGRQIDNFWEKAGEENRTQIVDFWRAISKRYRNEPAIVAYDIKNEPNYKEKDASAWWDDTLPKCIKAIRDRDKTVWLVVEPGPYGLPSGFANMPLVDDSRVIYSFHHYMSHAYCLQGVRFLQGRHKVNTRGMWSYPGRAPRFEHEHPQEQKTFYWDKAALEKSMQAAITFQKRHPKARIYVGEFGVVRWAPGAAQWLKDSIAIFEKHGWDWTFHSVGSWNGFDPTYAANAGPHNRPSLLKGAQDTDRLEVLKKAWALNVKEPSP